MPTRLPVIRPKGGEEGVQIVAAPEIFNILEPPERSGCTMALLSLGYNQTHQFLGISPGHGQQRKVLTYNQCNDKTEKKPAMAVPPLFKTFKLA